MDTAYARLEGRDFEFRMLKRRITIGRNSKLGGVDVNMGNSRFISRRHLDILMERNQLYLVCRGKNGVFVDDIFQKRENKRLQLPNSCVRKTPGGTVSSFGHAFLNGFANKFTLPLLQLHHQVPVHPDQAGPNLYDRGDASSSSPSHLPHYAASED